MTNHNETLDAKTHVQRRRDMPRARDVTWSGGGCGSGRGRGRGRCRLGVVVTVIVEGSCAIVPCMRRTVRFHGSEHRGKQGRARVRTSQDLLVVVFPCGPELRVLVRRLAFTTAGTLHIAMQRTRTSASLS
jgi:hypothetical protein